VLAAHLANDMGGKFVIVYGPRIESSPATTLLPRIERRMLTDVQKRAVSEAGIEVATLRLAAMSRMDPHAVVSGYPCPPIEKRDLKAWLGRRQRVIALYRGLVAATSVTAVAGCIWELFRAVGF